MTIQIIAKLIVGYRFSDLCVISPGKVSCISEKLEKEIARRFEHGTIDPDELTPEFLSIIFDLDFVEFSDKNDAIIGKTIEKIDIGTNDQEVRNFREIEMALAEVKTKVENLDSKIIELADIKISMIGDVKVGEGDE